MENLSEILKHNRKNYSLRELPDNFKPTWLESKIIKARITGESFCQMDAANLKSCMDKLILNCAGITGSGLPQTDFFADIITEQVQTYLMDYGYEILTYAEVMFAMNANEKRNLRLPSGLELEYVTFTGNHFNVAFLAKILNNYLILRTNLDRRLQNLIDGFE